MDSQTEQFEEDLRNLFSRYQSTEEDLEIGKGTRDKIVSIMNSAIGSDKRTTLVDLDKVTKLCSLMINGHLGFSEIDKDRQEISIIIFATITKVLENFIFEIRSPLFFAMEKLHSAIGSVKHGNEATESMTKSLVQIESVLEFINDQNLKLKEGIFFSQTLSMKPEIIEQEKINLELLVQKIMNNE